MITPFFLIHRVLYHAETTVNFYNDSGFCGKNISQNNHHAKYHKNSGDLVINCENLAKYHKKQAIVVILCVMP